MALQFLLKAAFVFIYQGNSNVAFAFVMKRMCVKVQYEKTHVLVNTGVEAHFVGAYTHSFGQLLTWAGPTLCVE